MCDRITHPERFEILRMTTPVKEQLAITVNVAFIEDDDQRWSLDKFLRKRGNARNIGRKTARLWINFTERRSPFLVDLLSSGLKWDLSQIGEAKTRIPYSGEIHFTVGRAWGRSCRSFLVTQIPGPRRSRLREGVRGHGNQDKSENEFIEHAISSHRRRKTRRILCVRRQ